MRKKASPAIRYFLALLALFVPAVDTIGQTRFYIAPDVHTDYFWTADDVTYRQSFLRMIDFYLDKMDATQSEHPDHQMRWQCDGSLWMWEYEKNRTPQEFERFISRIRSGHMSVALNALVLAQGGAPTESVIRGMLYPGIIERRHNVRFPMAIAMENQTLSYGLPSLWAGTGAKYSWKGVCNCASEVPALNDRDREIYYCGGRDGSKLLMKWQSQFTDNTMFGGYAEAYDPLASINFAETNSVFKSKYPYPVVGIFGKGWDELEYLSDEFVGIAKQHSGAGRRIIVSNQEDFFRDFEGQYGSGLETYSAAFGNDWDTLIASMAEVSGRLRRSTEKLRAAEAMATLVSVNDPAFMTSRKAERDRAMLNLGLFFEHDWTADGPIPRHVRAQWSRKVEREVTEYVDKLYDDARVALGRQISNESNSQRIFVFNPLSWERTDFADIPLRAGTRAHAVDVTTGKKVDSQLIRVGPRQVLRILADKVPSMGYKIYEIRGGVRRGDDSLSAAAAPTIENKFYRVTVAPDGAITSLIDKTRNNREMVKPINGKVLNDLGGDRSGSVVVESEGPVSVTLRAVSSSPIPHTTRITLFRDIDRIDIKNEITANFDDVHTWSYSFDLNSPDVWHEEVGAVIRAKLIANGGHYSPRNAKYDWLTLNHFADISQPGGTGVTISNWDNHFMRLGESGISTLDTGTPQINILAGGQTNGPGLGIPSQGGDRYFLQRSALRTHSAFDQTSAMRFSLEHQNPFVTGNVTGDAHDHYPSGQFSFMTITDPNVLLWALKPAEDGISSGIVARVWNQSSSAASYQMNFFRPIASAQQVTHIETPIGPAAVASGSLSADVRQQQIQTHLIKLQ